jgi:polygalacturonase
MADKRLASVARKVVHGWCAIVVFGLLISAASSPSTRWAWARTGDLVPIDIAQGVDDADSPLNRNLSRTIDVTTRGVVGDGTTCNSAAIQAIIDSLRPTGGTLRFPPGRYVTGTIRLHEYTTLSLDRGAVLLGSLDPNEYHAVRFCGFYDCFLHGTGLIVADRTRHVGITGRGTVNGRGTELAAHWNRGPLPFLCRWAGCDDVTVSGVTLIDPANWVQHFHRCRGVRLDRVTVRSKDVTSGNTDGIDIDSCQDVRITRCDISSGDDAICLKTTGPMACRNIDVENCRLSTRCNGLKFGTESVGPFEHIRIRRCAMTDVGQAGIAIFSVDGANIRDVTITDVQMRTVRTAIAIRLGSRLSTYHPDEPRRPTGSIQGVTIRGVRATDAQLTGIMVSGVPGHPVGAVTLDDVRIGLVGGVPIDQVKMAVSELPGDYPQDDMFGHTLPASGLYLRHVRGLTIGQNVTTETDQPDARPDRVSVDVAD